MEMIDTPTSLSYIIVSRHRRPEIMLLALAQKPNIEKIGPENSIMCDEPSLLALLCHFYDERAVVILTKKLFP
jgi:hypothetical protein